MTEKIKIKKYANRRLYNTEKSVYVTLAQVAEMVKQGNQIEVYDAKTKEDVTAFILSQIIMEQARKKNALLPVSLLHLIIQYGENVLEEFFEKYLEQTINNYLAYKRTVDEQFRKWMDMGLGLSDMTRKTFSGLTPFQAFNPSTKSGENDKKEKS